MTPQDHNKLIGVFHLVHGGMQAFGVLIAVVFLLFGGVLAAASGGRDAAAPLLIFVVVAALIIAVTAIFILPSIIAGYGMLKHKSWARTLGIIAAIVSLPCIPTGTALGVYSLWFLLGDEGKRFYLNGGSDAAYMTPPPPKTWQPQSPPDWRG